MAVGATAYPVKVPTTLESPVPSDVAELAARLRLLDMAALRSVAGSSTTSRGSAYAAQRRVSGLTATGGWTVSGIVRGSGRSYQTQVELYQSHGQLTWTGTCSCPMAVDCKHTVALAITARDVFGRAGLAAPKATLQGVPAAPAAPPPPPAWERALRELVALEQQSVASTPLGLLIEAETPRSYYGAPVGVGDLEVYLRPVVPGKRGWVKNGVTWGNLDYLPPYGSVRPDPAAIGALRALAAPALQHWGMRQDRMSLSALGSGWADRLRACSRAGVRLLATTSGAGEVRVVDEPAAVVLDLRRTSDGSIQLSPEILAPDAFDETEPVLVGNPPTAVVGRAPGQQLLLTHLDPPLDVAAHRLLQGGPVLVPPGDADRFLLGHAPRLARRFDIRSADGSVEVPEVGPVRLLLRLTHEPGQRIAVLWQLRYVVGGATIEIGLESTEQPVPRDLPAERLLLADVLALEVLDRVPRLRRREPTGDWALVPRLELGGADLLRLLNQIVPVLQQRTDVEVEVSGTPVDYTEATDDPVVRIAVSDSPDSTDWFDLDVSVHVGDEDVPLRALLTALTLGEELLILPSGTWFRTDRPELHELRRLVDEAQAMQESQRGPLRLSPYHADLFAELEQLGVVDEQSRRWRRVVEGLAASQTQAQPLPPPEGLAATLRPYQQAGFEWLTFLRRTGLGGILADDMGLGKTMQALAMILQARADADAAVAADANDPTADGASRAVGERAAYRPFLVVAPTSVLGTWVAEARRFAPSLRVVALDRTGRKRGSSVAAAVEGADLVITSYAVFRLDAEEFRAAGWSGLLLDEAQFVKNHQSQAYQCARQLPAPMKIAITGTPMENNLMELWALLSIVAPGLFPRPSAFAEHYRRPIETGGAPERLDILRRRIRPVMLRRTKESVATELPPKQEQVIEVALSPKHRRVYDRARTRERQRVLGLLDDPERNRIAILRSLTLLRRACLDPVLVDPDSAGIGSAKVDLLLELLTPVLAEGHQALVFSQFTGFLATVRERLHADGIGYAYLDGRTRKREEAIDSFRSGERPVFLVSLKAGGFGLTLTEADYVFLLDPWWNPAAEAQAIDRTHRIGQDKHVNVYRIVAADTIEQKVLALQERKRALFAQVVDDGDLGGSALSAQDIRELL